MHAAFNVDHGTGRLMGMGPRAHPATGPVLQRYLGGMPAEITKQIYFYPPGAPATGGGDDAAFGCYQFHPSRLRFDLVGLQQSDASH